MHKPRFLDQFAMDLGDREAFTVAFARGRRAFQPQHVEAKWARDRAANIFKNTEEYWAAVPGSNLYLVASSLTSYNVRYVEPSDIDFVEQELGTGVIITPLPPDDESSSVES